jgi:hypothetical protein
MVWGEYDERGAFDTVYVEALPSSVAHASSERGMHEAIEPGIFEFSILFSTSCSEVDVGQGQFVGCLFRIADRGVLLEGFSSINSLEGG